MIVEPSPSSALLLIPTEALHAQVLIGYLLGEKLSSPTFNMGFEIGINFATLEGMDGAERTTKTVFGLFADWRFSEHFHLTGAFLPFAGRGADGLDPVPTGDPAIDSQTQGGTMNRSMHLIEFPVLLKWAPKRDDGISHRGGTVVRSDHRCQRSLRVEDGGGNAVHPGARHRGPDPGTRLRAVGGRRVSPFSFSPSPPATPTA